MGRIAILHTGEFPLNADDRARFGRAMLRNEDQARDAAYLRAFRFYRSFRDGDGRGWLIKIVRNACNELARRGAMPRFDLYPGNSSKQAGKIAGLRQSMRKGGY